MKRPLLIAFIILLTTTFAEAQANKTVPSANVGSQAQILRFYPNPATTVITFDFQKAYEKGYSMQIYSFLGRKMIEKTNIQDQTTIDLTDFTRGVYIYKLFDKNSRLVETGKFQVSK